jgi:hypothetical protein
MQDRPHYLFEGSSALDLSRRIQDKAMSDLKGYDDNAMLSRSEDDLVAELLVANNLEFPNMRDSETWVEETELTREVRPLGYDVYSDGMGSYVRKFHTIIFHIPFTGDGNLFSVAPSSRSIPGPAAVVGRQELLFSIETAHKTEEIIRREYEARVQSINKHREKRLTKHFKRDRVARAGVYSTTKSGIAAQQESCGVTRVPAETSCGVSFDVHCARYQAKAYTGKTKN